MSTWLLYMVVAPGETRWYEFDRFEEAFRAWEARVKLAAWVAGEEPKPLLKLLIPTRPEWDGFLEGQVVKAQLLKDPTRCPWWVVCDKVERRYRIQRCFGAYEVGGEEYHLYQAELA
ncbi:hypothetical protein CSW47_10810 [Thermus scotoductus]|uniref:Uncharacterized protein n=1 Tax=Thermus scotoductus TaxID=37636 RepID=A0A430R4Q7_THESC|nr:hypothetical protein [Thermus scotoductus]RTH02389.1 hypothetical protein CSW47_10810 [Thermus scotoductus]